MNLSSVLNGTYDYRLVVVSLALAMVASYAALDLAGRVTNATGLARGVWLTWGASAMGLGIWSMHYVGMLALAMPIPVAYHLPTVTLSLLAGVAASAVALFVVSRSTMNVWQGIAGSVVMGSGIAALHYIGMGAMRCSAVIVYNRVIVGLSVLLAIVISFVALQLAFRLREEPGNSLRRIFAALVMGSAIPLMHYTGMWAASFHTMGATPDLAHAIGISPIGVAAISGCTFLVLAAAIASSFFDRFMSVQRVDLHVARERELYFQTMAEALPEIIWTANSAGEDDYFNRKCFEYTGMSFQQLQGYSWKNIVHPDDVDNCCSQWQVSLKTGTAYTVEYRLRGKDGSYKWFLGRGNPIRDAKGEIIKWFGTCTDIESQKQNQQILEEQILERTMQLADANRRLEAEMVERDIASAKFDEQNVAMMNDLEQRSSRATMLASLGELLQSCENQKEVVAAALGFGPRIFPNSRGALALLNPQRNLAEIIGSWNDCQITEVDFELSACWALRTGHPHLVPAGDSTARCAHAASEKHSYLCIPILAQGKTLGVMHFQATDAVPQLDPSRQSFKVTFAAQVGLSIANIQLREALRSQSVRDALTGLYNRRYLEEVLDREVRRASRGAQSLGVMMIDLDFFKTFNDSYGHDAGDAVLREIATSLTKGIRAEDFVCRFGGEEFVIILPTADLASSRARAERLRERTRELTIIHQGKSMGMITISVGVAAFPEHGTSPKELMAAADAALYEAKRGGRDQVVVASRNRAADEAATLSPAKAVASWG